jgi:hypothetical protein
MGNEGKYRLFSETLDQFIAVFGEPLARVPDDNERILFTLGGDEEFRVRELEFDEIFCDVHRRVAEDLVGEGVHEGMSFTLNEETCLVAFQLEYFYNHAPMVGELKTINVWVSGGWAHGVSPLKKRGEKEWF